jgi:hypothetical protein
MLARRVAALAVLLGPIPAACVASYDERDLTRDRGEDGGQDAGAWCPDNLVSNPGFEDGTSGWSAYAGTLEWTMTESHQGSGAGRACNDMTRPFYTVGLDPTPVTSPQQGARYDLSGWARTDSPATQIFAPVIREIGADGQTLAESPQPGITLDGSWQRASTGYTVMATDSLRIEAYFAATPPDQSDAGCFQLDDVCFALSGSSRMGAQAADPRTGLRTAAPSPAPGGDR